MKKPVARSTDGEAAVRHLLHHLENARQLRSNHLVAHFFDDSAGADDREVLARIRAAVSAAAEHLKGGTKGAQRLHQGRHHAIVTRCDLGYEVHKRVAADLGLSLRHFYRERNAAHARLAELLRWNPATAIVATTALDRSDLALAYARSLRDAGRTDAAIETLRGVASEAQGAENKVECMALSGEWLIDADRIDRAGEALDAGLRIAEGGPPLARRRMIARLDVARAALLWARGEAGASRDLSVNAIAELRHVAGNGDRALLTASIAASLRHAANEDDLGFLHEALRALETAGELLGRLQPAPVGLRARHLALLALLRAELYGDEASTGTTVERALDFARTGAFGGDTVLAVVAYSIHLEMNRNDAPGALKVLRECVAFAQASCLPSDLGLLYKRIAECEALHGDADAAKAFATRAREVLPRGSLGWVDAHCFEATADLKRRRYLDAVDAASIAATDARRMNNHRRLGCALRLLAEGYSGLGRRAESANAIEEAIDVLEGRTHARALSLAYSVSALVTGNPRHRALAQELAR
ncbi:MAG TPA: hypothetical protein VJP85_06000 [Candidatus Baltobacteraceae bacterium]|nr:hypothetical protein [Candidatus Baltobacteraceae bacterium]